jgi:isoquinoline 1-oxidoreductase subunit beta
VQLQSHAMQEPRAAVARFESAGDTLGLELWTGSQDVFAVKRHAARDLGLAEERVVVHACRMGGAFGGREHYDVERDAARLARAVGRPVKVQWSREDEFRAARHRPGSGHRVRLRADERGRLTDWWHAFVSGYIVFARERLPGWLLGPAHLFGDLGVARGCEPPYAIARRRVEYDDVDLPVDLGTWRSLGASPNTFAIESAIDELARQRGLDPVELRLGNIPPSHARLADCLRRTRELAESAPLPAGSVVGRGYACGVYDERSFVAASADVRVDPATGAISVLRMCCAQDVGLAVNPDQLEAQIEGNLIWGIGMALHERVEIGASEVASLNFDRYEIPRMSDAPALEIAILDRRDVPPAGAGETALIVAAPAIANALRGATGRRFTRLPIRSAAASASRSAPRAGGSAEALG